MIIDDILVETDPGLKAKLKKQFEKSIELQERILKNLQEF